MSCMAGAVGAVLVEGAADGVGVDGGGGGFAQTLVNVGPSQVVLTEPAGTWVNQRSWFHEAIGRASVSICVTLVAIVMSANVPYAVVAFELYICFHRAPLVVLIHTMYVG